MTTKHSTLLALLALSPVAFFAQTPTPTPAENEPVKLENLVVTDTRDTYVVKDSTAGTKTDLPLLDTPMSVQVVPRDVIVDRAERTVLDAAKNISGVQAATYQFYDYLMIRGFDGDYGSIYRNGLQLRGINESVNTAFVDRVEVAKGPSSMLYGRIQPGGFVNVVTKKPQAVAASSVDLSTGSWGAFRASVDTTGRLSADGRLLYRVIADHDQADSWVQNAHRSNQAFAGMLSWQPAANLDLNLQVEHNHAKSTWLDASIPVIGNRPADLPRNFSILLPVSWTTYPYTVDRTLVSGDWRLVLGPKWKLIQRFVWQYSREDQQGVYVDPFSFDGVATMTEVRFTHNPGWTRHTVGTNLELTGELLTGAIRHNVLLGVDWARFSDDTPGSTGPIPGGAPFNIFAPVYPDYSAVLRSLAAADATNVLWRDWSRDLGFYFQDHLTLNERWSLLAGGRFDTAADAYSQVYATRDDPSYPHATGYPVVAQPDDHAFSPRAGLLYKIASTVSVYASYSKSFGSANGADNNGNPLKPQIGTQYEIGLKAEWLKGRITGSATAYDLTKSNITEYDPLSNFPRVVGEARSRGLEFDLAGQLTPHLSVLGSYAYDDARITRDPFNGTEGHRLGGVAPHTLNLWAKYDLAGKGHDGWSFGAGAFFTASREGDDENTWQLPGYGRCDAMLAYRAKIEGRPLTLQLNVNNVFDRKYFDHGGYGIAAYGAPRGFTVSARAEF